MKRHSSLVVILYHKRSLKDEEDLEKQIRSLINQADYAVYKAAPGETSITGYIQDYYKKSSQIYNYFSVFFAHTDVVWADNSIYQMELALTDTKTGIVASGTNDPKAAWLYVADEKNRPHNLSVKYVDNHAWGWRTTLVDKIGFPDETGHFLSLYSNIDYCYRAKQKNFNTIAVRKSYVWHNKLSYEIPLEAYNHGLNWLMQKYPKNWKKLL